jgi:hypothetical protein
VEEKHLSDETKRKLSEIFKGRPNPKISEALKGRHFSEEHKRKLSEAKKGKRQPKISEAMKGSKNHKWKGGITPEYREIRKSIEYRLWREAVFARDNWTCQKCKKRGGKLHPHHILNFAEHPELRFALDNGITLCEECHKEFHRIYGNKHNTKEQLEEFLKQEVIQ